MGKWSHKLLLGVLLLLCAHITMAQKLEVEGGLDDRSVSKLMRDGVASSRVIIQSNVKLSYSTNMGDDLEGNIGSGELNGLLVDTLYFFMDPFDTRRRLIISAEGFVEERIDVDLTPKATYSYVIINPTVGGSEYSQLLDSAKEASKSHKYSVASGIYTQALSAEGAPEDLSPIHEYIRIMNECAEHEEYGKKCLIMAKQLREGDSVDLDMVKGYYYEAYRCFSGIQRYLNDDKYSSLLDKLQSIIDALPLVIEGVVMDAESTFFKIAGVKVCGLVSLDSKDPIALTTTDENGKFHIELSSSDIARYKYLLFDTSDVKGYKRGKTIDLKTVTDHTKMEVKLFK